MLQMLPKCSTRTHSRPIAPPQTTRAPRPDAGPFGPEFDLIGRTPR
jgi:hypothetical protein